MLQISPQLEQELELRLKESAFGSVEDLLRGALNALDAIDANEEMLQEELLAGLEGEDIEVTPDTWARLEREALSQLDANSSS